MALYFYPICLSILLAVWISCFVICYSLQIELNIQNSLNLDSKRVKIICVFPRKRFQAKRKLNIQNANFDLNSLGRKNTQNAVFSPNISTGSRNGFNCYLSTFDWETKKLRKKRHTRELTFSPASVTAVNGVCQPGHRIDQDRCYPCFPGSYTSGQETECFLCPKDFYMDKEAADSCWPCPQGKKTLAEGANSLDLCIHPGGANNKGWIIGAILLLLVLTLSWIVVIGLIVYILRLRRKRSLVKEKTRREITKKRLKKTETDAEGSSNSLSRKRSLSKSSSLQSLNDEMLKNTAKETSPQAELDIQLRNSERTPDHSKELKRNVFEIRSPAKKNFFFINQSGEPFLRNLLHGENKNGRKDILKSGDFEYSVIDSEEASSNSGNHLLSNGERSTYIDQTKGNNTGKRLLKNLEHKAQVSGREMKSKKKRATRKPVSSSHNVNGDLNQEINNPEIKMTSLGNSQSQQADISDASEKLTSPERDSDEKGILPNSKKVPRNRLENPPTGMNSTSPEVGLKSENFVIIPNCPPSKTRESSASVSFPETKSSSQKSSTSSNSLYVAPFSVHQLIDLNPDSSNGSAVSNTRTGLTSHKSGKKKNSYFSNSNLKEIKISIEPDSDDNTENIGDLYSSHHSISDGIQQLNKETKIGMEHHSGKDRRSIRNSYLSKHSDFDDFQQFLNEPYVYPLNSLTNESNVCPMHLTDSKSNRSSPIHVDINLQFVT